MGCMTDDNDCCDIAISSQLRLALIAILDIVISSQLRLVLIAILDIVISSQLRLVLIAIYWISPSVLSFASY